jgi:hypothetical protein
MKPKVTDVEEVKKQVRKQVAGRVLGGETADVNRVLADMDGCQVKIAAGYGSLSDAPQAVTYDRMLWILDGYAEVYGAAGWLADLSQGESMVLSRNVPYRLVFTQLSIYCSVEAELLG